MGGGIDQAPSEQSAECKSIYSTHRERDPEQESNRAAPKERTGARSVSPGRAARVERSPGTATRDAPSSDEQGRREGRIESGWRERVQADKEPG